MSHESRDRAMEQMLRRTRAGGPDDSGACLDAEMLAAFVDGGLDMEARASVETHLSGCGRCQATLAALVRASAPAVADAPTIGIPPTVLAGWRRTPRTVRWFVPLAAGLAAVTVWMIRPVPSPDGEVADTFSSQARVESSAPAALEAEPTPSAAKAASPAASSTAAPSVAPIPEPAAAFGLSQSGVKITGDTPAASDAVARDARAEQKAEAGVRANQLAEPVGQATGGATADEKRRAASQESLAALPPTRAAVPPMAPIEAMADAAPAAPITRESGAMATNAARAASPPPSVVAPAPVPVPVEAVAKVGQDSTGRLRQADRTVLVLSPNPQVRWRVGASGVVEGSRDGGATWQPGANGAAEVTGGASPSASVCWLIGRGGTVWVTTDGRSWRRVTAPAAEDLTGVQATDGRAASVTTAAGRAFRTVDGGATWQPVPR